MCLPVSHVDKGEDAVESGHEDVSQGQVHQEVVCHAPHATVGWNFYYLKWISQRLKKYMKG